MSQTFSISDLSREFDVTPRTIRYYEAEGMLAPAREGQRRVYSLRDRVTLALILRGKRLGFPHLAVSPPVAGVCPPVFGAVIQKKYNFAGHFNQ